MSDWKVPLVDVVIGEPEIEAVVETYRSGWLSMGPRTEALEAELAEYTGAAHAVALSSATAALELAAVALGLGPGDEAIVPSMTFVATVSAIIHTGAKPVFAEIAGPTEPWLSAAAAEAAINSRTRAIVTMAYGGHPGETEALKALAKEHGLILIEDSAHALGSRLGGRHLGSFGDVGAFSFFANKNLGIGEGGALITADEQIAERVRLMRSHGMTSGTWERRDEAVGAYDVIALGSNNRIDEPRAALASARLRVLDAENARRAEIYAVYRERLAAINGVEAVGAPPADSKLSHHLFAVVLDPRLERDAFRTALADAGVQTSVHYPAVHRFSLYEEPKLDLPLTEDYAAHSVSLPIFATMTDEQLQIVLDAVTAAAG